MKIAITGDRNWKDYEAICDVISYFPKDTIWILGDAKGADHLARRACKGYKREFIEEKADWAKYGRGAGHIRNRAMLDHNPDLVIYFHDDLENSKGTKNCCEQADASGILAIPWTKYKAGLDILD